MRTRLVLTIFLICFGFLSVQAAVAQDSGLEEALQLKKECENGEPETRLGYPKAYHCSLHGAYKKTFGDVWKCSCGWGRCRPTNYRGAHVSQANPYGIEVFVSGQWYPVPEGTLRMGKENMPSELFEFEAHVCASESMPPHIECVWLRIPS